MFIQKDSSYTIAIPTLEEVYALHGAAMVVIVASIFGSGMVIFSTIRRSKYSTIGERFPLYVAIIDFMWSVSHSIDHAMMLVNKGESPPPLVCKSLGAVLALFLMAQVMLLNIIAVSMFLTVYRGWALSYGKFDWILMVLTFGVPIAYTCVGLAVDAFGPDLYWCYLNPFVTSGNIMWSITFIAAICCIGLPAFCYYMIYWKITETARRLQSLNEPNSSGNASSGTTAGRSGSNRVASTPYVPYPGSSSSHGKSVVQQPAADFDNWPRKEPMTMATQEDAISKKNRLIVEKLMQYEMVLIITFSSLIVYGANIVAKQEPLWMVFLVVICFNSAGWLNAVVFFYQDWKKRGNFRDRDEAW
ncbi:hypothetical protein HDU97_003869 [Phlyctochytrium planicorne]|nr:hypothetical protein HDU97_003869 [Phlyctochytrium planicorne]